MIREIFEDYGPITQISLERNKGIIHFCSEGSAVSFNQVEKSYFK